MGRHLQYGGATVVVIRALVIGIVFLFAEQLTAAQNTKKCWIFTHMNKSGGSSIKKLLRPWMEHNNVTQGSYDSQQWTAGMGYARGYIKMGNTITWGGYTEGLRPYGAQKAQHCKWFTMFRHPISRVVSAFYFCKKRPHDQLCADFRGKTDMDDVVGFSKHWGNFGLMQFVLGFVKPEDVAAESTWAETSGEDVCIHTDKKGQNNYLYDQVSRCPGWYLLKLFVESRSDFTSGEPDEYACESATASLNQVWMHQFLRPAMDVLSDKYAAVGLVEHWDTSMQLFQFALELPNMNWHAASGVARKNSDFYDEEAATLREAWCDPRIRELLWLDILLYDHAVSIFNKQVVEYDLSTR